MHLPFIKKRHAKHAARIGTVLAVSVLSIGSASAEPVAANAQFVAKVQSITPVPIQPRVTAPVVQQEVVQADTGETEQAEVTTQVAAKPARKSRGGGGGGDVLGRIRACESGGRYTAVSGSGKYRGAYQFDYRTWAGVGGSGDPAAASPAEQDSRAAALYARRGGSPWPVCSRR